MNIAARYWQSLSPALQRYYKASVVPCLLFLALGWLHEWAVAQEGLGLAARAAFAIAPVLCFVWLFACYLRFLRDCDELERRIETDALAWAAGIGLIATFAAVFLLDAGVVAWSAIGVALAIMLLITIVYALVRGALHRRYP